MYLASIFLAPFGDIDLRTIRSENFNRSLGGQDWKVRIRTKRWDFYKDCYIFGYILGFTASGKVFYIRTNTIFSHTFVLGLVPDPTISRLSFEPVR